MISTFSTSKPFLASSSFNNCLSGSVDVTISSGLRDGTKPILMVSIFSAALAVNGAVNPATKVAIKVKMAKSFRLFFILRIPPTKIIDSTQIITPPHLPARNKLSEVSFCWFYFSNVRVFQSRFSNHKKPTPPCRRCGLALLT